MDVHDKLKSSSQYHKWNN